MPRIARSQISVRDYEEIWHYIAAESPVAADRLISDFEQRLSLLLTMPAMGKDESDLVPGLRSLAVGTYLLYYRPLNGGIELVRALHAARDITAGHLIDK